MNKTLFARIFAVTGGFLFFLTFHHFHQWGVFGAVSASMAVTSPAADNADVSGIYTFSADTSNFPTVASVEFAIGSMSLGIAKSAPYQVSWNTGYGGDGNYALQVTAYDGWGNTIGSGERIFNIKNRGNTMSVSAPDINQPLSGTVTFEVPTHDATYYPAIYHLFVDGEFTGYWDIASSILTHDRTAKFIVDTTKFANGKHELVVDVNSWKDTTLPHTYAMHPAMIDRAVTFQNGHTLMEISANYQNVYLEPGQQIGLTCARLFTDNAKENCAAPSYTSDNASVGSVTGSGLVNANSAGFTTVKITEGAKTTEVHVWVKSATPVSHFSGDGRILNSYQPGSSLFLVAPFVLDPALFRNDPTLLPAIKRAGINTTIFGFYLNPRSTSTSFAAWKSSQDNLITSRVQSAKNSGLHILASGDDGFRRPGDDAWWTLNWSSGQAATEYAMQTLAGSGVAIGVDVVDEAAMIWGWYPVSPSKVGEQGLPGQPGSFQNIVCNGTACTVNWPKHNLQNGMWTAFKNSIHSELNTLPGEPFTVQNATSNSFAFIPVAPLTGTFDAANDPQLEIMHYAKDPCNAGTTDGKNHPCIPFTPNDAVKIYSGWLHHTTPRVAISWPALGFLPPEAHANWVGKPAMDQGISDFTSHFWDAFSPGSRTYSWSSGVQNRTSHMKMAFYSRQPYMVLDRPQLILVCGSSFFYTKQTSGGAYYNPPTDTLIQPGCDGAVTNSEIMTAAALGNAGVRIYQFDLSAAQGIRATAPAGSDLQTGIHPSSEEQNAREMWRATGYAANLLTKALEPFVFGTSRSSPAYERNITTAVRQNGDGTMLMIVNGNDGARTVSVDFTPYRTGIPITRYQVSAKNLQTDLLADGPGETITLQKGESTVYLFPSSPATVFARPVAFTPTPPPGGVRATLAYNYIYDEDVPVSKKYVDCTGGCALDLDLRLRDVYYQFTYLDANNAVVSRSPITKLNQSLPLPVISSFFASSTSICAGGSSVLSWSVSNAARLSLNQGIGDVTGTSSKTVSSATTTTTYTLTATNYDSSVSVEATVAVRPISRDTTSRKVTGIDSSMGLPLRATVIGPCPR